MVKSLAHIVLITLVLLMASCFNEDIHLNPPQPDWMTLECDLSDSTGQLYLDINQRSVVRKENIHSWDIAFDSRKDSFSLILNWSRGMACYNTGLKRLTEYQFDDQVDWHYEKIRTGNRHTAIGEWGDFGYENPQSYGIYYLISLGYDAWGQHMGYTLMSIRDFEDNHYEIEFADPISPKESFIYRIPKSQKADYTYFSFRDGGHILPQVEWPANWHIMTSPMLSDEKKSPYDLHVKGDLYLNYGILLNPEICEVAIDSSGDFSSLKYVDALNMSFSSDPSAIGASWYSWNQQTQSIQCHSTYTYVVRLINGMMYKIQIAQAEREGHVLRLKLAVKNL
jgi:hypothetical protein